MNSPSRQWAFCPLIDSGLAYLVANIMAICLIFAAVAARIFRASVREAVGPDDLRCSRCGYLLRGLEIPRCPECGYDGNREGRVEYGFRWQRTERFGRSRRFLPVACVIALLFGPVWLPLGLMSLPRSWLRYVPTPIRPHSQVLHRNPHAYPIRLDAVCVIRHEAAIAVIRFEPQAAYRSAYEVSYWVNEDDLRRKNPAESTSRGLVTNGRGPTLPVGPWSFSYSMAAENMLWLTRPDDTFHVEAFTPDGLPSELRWAAEGP